MEPEKLQQMCLSVITLMELIYAHVAGDAEEPADDPSSSPVTPPRRRQVAPDQEPLEIQTELRYTLEEAARYLKISIPTIRNWIRDEKVASSKGEGPRNGKIYINGSELLRLKPDDTES